MAVVEKKSRISHEYYEKMLEIEKAGVLRDIPEQYL